MNGVDGGLHDTALRVGHIQACTSHMYKVLLSLQS